MRRLIAVDGKGQVLHRTDFDEFDVGEADDFIRKCNERGWKVHDESTVETGFTFIPGEGMCEVLIGDPVGEVEPELAEPVADPE